MNAHAQHGQTITQPFGTGGVPAVQDGPPKGLAAIGQGLPVAIVPQNFEDVFRFAKMYAASGLAPYGMQKPEQIAIAILTGLELGIKPMQAVQGIAVINGRPSIWGDLALGLVRGSGTLEYIKETYEGTPPKDWEKPVGDELQYKAVCRVKRKGEPEEIYSEFSIEDAKVAKLWQKKGGQDGRKDTPWVTNPKRMLKMRARAFALRDTFTDSLKGLNLTEEMIGNEEEAIYGQSTSAALEPATPPDVQDVQFTEVKPAEAAPAAPMASIDDAAREAQALIDEVKNQCSTAQTPKDVEEINSLYADDIATKLSRSQQEELAYFMEQLQDRLTPPPAQEPEKPKQTRKRSTPADREEGRQRVGEAGGKGVKEYMDEDRQDDAQAMSIEKDEIVPPEGPGAPADLPDNPFAEMTQWRDEEHYAMWIRRMIANTESLDHAATLAQRWKDTKDFRRLMAPVLRDQLFMEVNQKVDEIKAKNGK